MCRPPPWSIRKAKPWSRSPRRRRNSRPPGVVREKRVIAYCGGGISATIDLFLLHQLGFDELTLYDGSMGEWAKDTTLPIERVEYLAHLRVIASRSDEQSISPTRAEAWIASSLALLAMTEALTPARSGPA